MVVPFIIPGCAGMVFTVMDKLCREETPQEFCALTVIFPLAEPAVALIELDMEVPVHPEGNVQLYAVAPLTGVIE